MTVQLALILHPSTVHHSTILSDFVLQDVP